MQSPLSKNQSPSFQDILPIFSLLPKERSPFQKKHLISYLTSSISFFSSQSAEEDKIEKLCDILHHETFGKGNKITNSGEEVDKLFILLSGSISIHSPLPKIKEMKFKDYIQYLSIIKDSEKNIPKLKRVMAYNDNINHNEIKQYEYDYTKFPHQNKFNNVNVYTIEEEELVDTQYDGYEFNIEAIHHKTVCEFNIYACNDIHIGSISRGDYAIAMRELEIKRKQNEIKEFKEKFPLFQEWPNYNMVCLFKGLCKKVLYSEEYLYKQNEKSEYVYFVKEGVFEMTSKISVSEYETYIKYIYDASNKNEMKLNAKKDMFNPLLVIDNESEKWFKAKIKNILAPECIGYEEGIENKLRFCSVKCISTQSEVDVIHINDFVKLLPDDNHNKFILQKNMFEKKMYLISQIKSNAVKRFVEFDNEIQYEYDVMFNKNRDKEKKGKNTKKILKSSSTENINININSNNDINKTKKTIDNGTQTKNTNEKYVYECNEIEEVKMPKFHNQILLRNQSMNIKEISTKNASYSGANIIYSSYNNISSSNLMSFNTTNDINRHIKKKFSLMSYPNYKSILDEMIKLDKAYRRNVNSPFDAMKSIHYTSFINNGSVTKSSSFIMNQSTNMSNSREVKEKKKMGWKGGSCKRSEIPTTIKLKYFTQDFNTKIMKRMRNLHKVK